MRASICRCIFCKRAWVEKDDGKPAGPVLEEKVVCPICLEEYQASMVLGVEGENEFVNRHHDHDREPGELVECPPEIKAEIQNLLEASKKRWESVRQYRTR